MAINSDSSRLLRISLITIASGVAVLSYQNCSSGFAPADFVQAASDGVSATPVDSSTLDSSGISASYLFVGAPNKIAGFKIDRSGDQVTRLADVNLNNRTPGWFSFDAAKSRVFVADGFGTQMTSLILNPLSGLLASESILPIISNVIHFSIYPTNTGYRMYAASYDKSMAAAYDLASPPPIATQLSEVDFAAGTDSHSITADRDASLVFLANKDESMIRIYSDAQGSLFPVGTFAVPVPRIILYDSVYNHIYLSTQSSAGASYVSIYDVVATNGNYTLSLLGTVPMGVSGSDLKIDHANGYVSASVRETGAEGIWMFPIDKMGVFDSTRSKTFLPITEVEARSLQISSDGKYYAVSCNNSVNTQADTIVYKITYDSNRSVTASKIITKLSVGPANVLSNLWIDIK